MRSLHQIDKNLKNQAVCPYLKWKDDETVRYRFPHAHNYCYRPRKRQPVQLAYQENYCLVKNYEKCDLISNDHLRRLPKEIRVRTNFKIGKSRRFYVILLFLFLIFGIGIVFMLIGGSRLKSNVNGQDLPAADATEEVQSNSGSLSLPENGIETKNSNSKNELGKINSNDLSSYSPSEINSLDPYENLTSGSEIIIPISGYQNQSLQSDSLFGLNIIGILTAENGKYDFVHSPDYLNLDSFSIPGD